MSSWLHNPIIYEINTWVWLDTLSRERAETITLGNVPESVIDELSAYHIDAVWLMGIWYRSPAGHASALNYIHEYRGALPDIREQDVIGSAYAIGAYKVDLRLGGREGLATFRKQLQARNIKLILDFVPNHVAIDHRWVKKQPDCFITGAGELLKERPSYFFNPNESNEPEVVVAHGRDPYFPAWIDTAQLNAFSAEYRAVTVETLLEIASLCDGVRCDMAMLLLNNVFKKTWEEFIEDVPEVDFWDFVIPQVHAQHPHFIFLAEVYWGLEAELLKQGFQFTYDKTLYDRMVNSDVYQIKEHLQAGLKFLERNIRFIENHDEPRAATSLGDRSRAAATLILTIPGATLLHDGQFRARRVKLPVQIKRQPDEPFNQSLHHFYQRLLREASHPVYREGEWTLLDTQPAWEGSDTHHNLIVYMWAGEEEYRLIIINLTHTWSPAIIRLDMWEQLGQHNWRLYDVLHETYSYQSGSDIAQDGLSVEIAPYEAHIYQFSILTQPISQ